MGWLLLLLLLLGGGLAAWYFLRPQPARPLFTPASADFGRRLLGATGSEEDVRVEVVNGGERELRVDAVTVVGAEGGSTGDFLLVEEDCTAGVRAPGEGCAVVLRFEPATAELRRGELRLAGNLAWGSGSLPLVGVGIAPRPVLEPAVVEFAPQPATEGSEATLVRIVNVGSAPLSLGAIALEGEESGDFTLEERCSGKTLGVEERCAVRVAFAPRAAGERSATLAVASDAPGEPVRTLLRGTGTWTGPPFTAATAGLDFGDQRVGTRSRSRELEIVNRTAAPRPAPSFELSTTEAFSVGGGSCAGMRVPPGEGCSVETAFQPEREGAAIARLLIRDGDAQPVEVEVRGIGVVPRLTVDRPRLDFGSARVGTRTAALALTVTNSGSAPLRVAGSSVVSPNDRGFLIARDSCSAQPVAPGERCRVEVTFSPSTSGGHRAGLEIRSDAAEGTETVALVGEGTESALGLQPGSLDFDRVVLGSSAELELTISNEGTAPLEVRGLRAVGGDAADFEVASIGCRLDQGLEPGDACRIGVRFRPAAAGSRSARLEVAHDGSGGPGSVPLFGSAAPPVPGFRVTPEGIDFGGLGLGERSGIRTITIRNPGRGELVLRELVLTGAEAGDFQIVPGSCEGAPAIAAGSDCTVGVRFVPRALGTRRAALAIRHNAPGGGARVSLTGRVAE